MRIITGTARGCRLEALPGEATTRPTADRVKEGLFSALQFELEGRQVGDFFAGSGQLGLEALSRGAAGCVFIERDGKAAEVIRRNTASAARHDPSIAKRAQLLQTDVQAYLSRTPDTFDVALADPPYAAGLLEPTLALLTARMNPGGVIVCESDAKTVLPAETGDFRLEKEYRYGRVKLWLYRRLSV